MQDIFLTSLASPLARWSAAFPRLTCTASFKECLAHAHHAGDVCWVDISTFAPDQWQAGVTSLVAAGFDVVALTSAPTDYEGYELMKLGVRGYCHAESVPEQLQEVSQVVRAGGYWVPPGIIQRLIQFSTRIPKSTDQATVDEFEQLTERELEVAKMVGKGASNKEIAEVLSVSERTVKAHLTAIFEKLDLRDRVQLALAINRLPHH